MMKLGMINNFPTTESLDYVNSLGLEFIEMCNNNNEEAVRCHEQFDSMYENVKNHGLFIGSIGRWNPTINKGGKVDEEEFAIMKNILGDAVKIDCPTFVASCNYDDSVSLYKNYTVAIEYFGRLLEIAKGSKTRVAVCNCDWNNFVTNPTAWSVILGELPELMIKFDCSHSYNAGRDYMKELSDWGDRIAHVHIKGTVRTGGRPVDDPPAGMDDIKWPSVFATLYARKYDGCLSIEPHSAAWRFDSDLGRAGVRYTVDYIKKFIL